ncbi:glucose-1-phosphate thymidylyltransferase RfbA [Gammaproteobacteria bacterium]|nr:glucose-1-phosphate thymidylyltransferase RfbA [Gammaproteobacteria bacterium]
MKGIILAGGTGSRLHPVTISVSKQMLPIYDKPLIYYPLCTLMELGIKEILIISAPNDKKKFTQLLGNGEKWGLSLKYKTQEKPNGIAESFIIGKKFIGNEHVALILGDNIFYGPGFQDIKPINEKAIVFGYKVPDPERYGVVAFGKNHLAESIEEKPKKPKSNYAVTGLYIYANKVIEYAENLKPSKRGELEITDINKVFLRKNLLEVNLLEQGWAWLDAGTPDSLLQASNYIQTIQNRQSVLIGSPEATAFQQKFINKRSLLMLIKELPDNSYSRLLQRLFS